MNSPSKLDPHIIEAASRLFREQGYHQTTWQAIADETAIDVAYLQDIIGIKEKLALGLYHDLNDDLLAKISTLPVGTIARRFETVLARKVAQLAPYESAIAALFASAMQEQHPLQPTEVCIGIQDSAVQVYYHLVEDSIDTPRKVDDVQQIALMLYTFQMLVLLFWLYDRTPQKQATHHLISFFGELMKIARPMLSMPPVRKATTKIIQIMMLVFGGAHLTPDASL